MHTSWAKKLFLSAEENTDLRKNIEDAGKLLLCVEQICKDVRHIQNEIEWIKNPLLTPFSGELEYPEIVVLPQEFLTFLLQHITDSISIHSSNIGVAHTEIEKHIGQTDNFLKFNTPPNLAL